MLTLLHSNNPAAFTKQHLHGIPPLLDTAEAAHSLQCPETLQVLDVRLAELCPPIISAADALTLYQQAVRLPLPAFQAACVRFVAPLIASDPDLNVLAKLDNSALLPLVREMCRAHRASSASMKAAVGRAEAASSSAIGRLSRLNSFKQELSERGNAADMALQNLIDDSWVSEEMITAMQEILELSCRA